MNPRSRKMKVGLILISALLVFAIGGSLGAYLSSGSGGSVLSEVGDVLSLSRPAFAQGAGLTFLDDEAGMSIYTNASQTLDLSLARTVYEYIEQETADYIVGEVALPDQPESDDVHIFVHKDGWIVVYYPKAEVASKIIDWDYYAAGTLTKTKLHVGLEEMCFVLGVNPSILDINYYHFDYPFANKWTIIVECAQGADSDSFNLKVPSTFSFYQRSWSNYAYECGSYLYIDSTRINSAYWGEDYGLMDSALLGPDIFHTVRTEYYASASASNRRCIAIVLLYLEP